MGCASSMELDPDDMHVFGFARHTMRVVSNWRDARVFHRHSQRLGREMEGLRDEIGQCDVVIESLRRNIRKTETTIGELVDQKDRESALMFGRSKNKILASLRAQIDKRDTLHSLAFQLLDEAINAKIMHRAKRISALPIVKLSESAFQSVLRKLSIRTVVKEDQDDKIEEVNETVMSSRVRHESDDEMWDRMSAMSAAPSVPDSEPSARIRHTPEGDYI